MPNKRTKQPPAERILKVAADLFYRQGYQATGINQIIDQSGVAKASFYSHFPSKEKLCVAYLQGVAQAELSLVSSTMKERKTPVARYMAVIEVLGPWLLSTEFRGCPFMNIAAEVAEVGNPIRKVGVEFYREQRNLVQRCVEDLKRSDPKRYGKLDAASVAERYVTILVGAVGMCELFHTIDPLDTGIELVRGLIE